ncbi:MAG TPA: DNRLRE domain-containing protein, partial [Verrucomicrobiales bacterium]|nr:DNRLRE domain-containing protein [Verrucomicrobiales bacterium]
MAARFGRWICCGLALPLAGPPVLRGEEAVLEAAQDSAIFSEDGTLSSGQGWLFVGQTQGSLGAGSRRTLLRFELSGALPAGAVVDSAVLTLTKEMHAPALLETSLAVHRLTEAWGEGNSNATTGLGDGAGQDDATWTRRFFPAVNWNIPGGTFHSDPSAQGDFVMAPARQTLEWDGPGLTADVQLWLEDPMMNFGWILLGEEGRPGTALRLANAENPMEQTRPRLMLTYTAPSSASHRQLWLDQYFSAEEQADPAITGDLVDLDGDSLNTHFEYAFTLDPKTRDAEGGPRLEVGPGIPVLRLTRHTEAMDLTYRVEVSA